MTKAGRRVNEDPEQLPPHRARTQAQREKELFALVGLVDLTEREKLGQQVEALDRLIRSNKSALKISKLNEDGRLLLQRQITIRTDKLAKLRRQLAG